MAVFSDEGICSRLELISNGWFVLVQQREYWRRGFNISSNLSLQLPGNSCANVVGSFAAEMKYHDIGNSAKLNDYHHWRQWVSKGPKVCVRACVRACLCVYVC